MKDCPGCGARMSPPALKKHEASEDKAAKAMTKTPKLVTHAKPNPYGKK
jgi:hypothetical protein